MYAPFSIRFLCCSVALSFLIIGILFIKRVLRNHISAKFQYYIGFIFLFMLLIPFLPTRLFSLNNIYNWLPVLQQKTLNTTNLSFLANTSQNIMQTSDWLLDFSFSSSGSSYGILNSSLLSIWIIGMAAMAILTYLSNRKIWRVLKTAVPNQNTEVALLFSNCKQNIKINKNVILYTSPLVSAPITFGVIRPCIILPHNITLDFSVKDIHYILLHELQHYKSKDILINYAMCFARILYWFHPLVWYALKEMRTDREIACDVAVLKMLDKDHYIDYGNTLINFANKILRSSALSIASEISGSKKQIKCRIIKIAAFHQETKWLTIKSVMIFALVGVMILISTPILSINASLDSNYEFSSSRIKYEDLSTYFEGYNGSFVLYDLQNHHYHIFNQEQSEKRVAPASTFKVYSALFALETGSITKDNSTLTWDQTEYMYTAWNKNQDLSSAMKNSVNWYFQYLDHKIGIKTLRSYYEQIGYGNLDFSGGIYEYWAESSLKISPIEQVELLQAFYRNDFGFQEENIQAVKEALLLSESEGASLSGKTGTGNVNGKNINGWFIGYVETNSNTYFFATNIQNDDYCNSSTAAKITLSILNDKNIYSSK